MAVEKIGYQTGIEATRQRLNVLDPGRTAFDKQAATLNTLVKGHNSTLDRLSALEARQTGPFPQ